MLTVSRLRVKYGSVEAVRGVSLAAESGAVMLVLGRNGAGKSTTLRAVCGAKAKEAGEVALAGKSTRGMRPEQLVKRGLVMVPEGRRIFATLTTEENLRVGGHARPRGELAGTLSEVYELFPILRERREVKGGFLSGGEQQMLAFGRAMMARPTVMLLDEPSLGLSPRMVEEVFSAARRIADHGIAVVMVEQNAEAALAIADHVSVMDRGEITYSGDVKAARGEVRVLESILGNLGEGVWADAEQSTPQESN